MLKSHFRAKSNGYGDFLVRVPGYFRHLKWSKFIQIMLLNDMSFIFLYRPTEVAFWMLLKVTSNDIFEKKSKNMIYLRIYSENVLQIRISDS